MSRVPHPKKWFCPTCVSKKTTTNKVPCPRCCGYASIRRPLVKR